MQSLRSLLTDETRALDEALASLSERAKQPLSLAKLLQRWSDLVVQIERGYEDSIYEYINDLTVRDILEEVLHQVPQSLSEDLLGLIRPWDERFYKATRGIARPLSHGIKQMEVSPWWFRVPIKMGQEFEDDLRSEGILE